MDERDREVLDELADEAAERGYATIRSPEQLTVLGRAARATKVSFDADFAGMTRGQAELVRDLRVGRARGRLGLRGGVGRGLGLEPTRRGGALRARRRGARGGRRLSGESAAGYLNGHVRQSLVGPLALPLVVPSRGRQLEVRETPGELRLRIHGREAVLGEAAARLLRDRLNEFLGGLEPPPRGALHVRGDGRVAIVDGEPVELTATEARLLGWLAAYPRRVFSADELLRLVWRYETVDGVGTGAVRSQVRNLRRKLGGGHVIYHHRRGYSLL